MQLAGDTEDNFVPDQLFFLLEITRGGREYNSVRNTSKGSWNRYVPEKKTLKNFVFSQFTVLFKLFEDLRWIVFSSSASKWT